MLDLSRHSVDRPDWRGREIEVDGIVSRWGWNPAEDDPELFGSHAPQSFFSVRHEHPGRLCDPGLRCVNGFDAYTWCPADPIVRFTSNGLEITGGTEEQEDSRTEDDG